MNPTQSPRPDQDAIAGAWYQRAPELARWARKYLVVRSDAFGGHRADGGRTTVKAEATRERLVRHFRAVDTEDIIGLHTASPVEMCMTTWIDIDAHEGDGADPKANLRFALHVYYCARAAGLDVRLIDSNGKGGYHILIVHRRPISLADSWRLGKFLVREHTRFGFTKPPETFPKRPVLSGKRYGGWVRLPGRHHKRPHWTRVWSPRRDRWLEGDAAIKSLLRLRGHQVDLATVIPPGYEPARHRSKRIHSAHLADEAPLTGWRHRHDLRLARAALEHLGAEYRDDYHEWLRVGMALSQLGPEGLAIWEAWSRPSRKYEPDACEEKWGSFEPGEDCDGVTLGTLFALAQHEGWKGPGAYIEEYDDETGVRRRTSPSGRRGTIIIPTRTTRSDAEGAQ